MTATAVVVRSAAPQRDAPACQAIYARQIAGPSTFEEQAPGVATMARRIAAAHVFLVAGRGDAVAGYACAGPHRDRPAYRWSAEVSVYVDASHHRRGVGRALYLALLEQLRLRGLRVALAGITLPNAASVGLHEGLGFVPVGVYRNVGYKAGAWRDVGWWQLDLGAPTGVPREPALSD